MINHDEYVSMKYVGRKQNAAHSGNQIMDPPDYKNNMS